MQPIDSTIWIVHRNSGSRAALARVAGTAPGAHEIILGGPDDLVFDSAAAPQVIVLGLSGAAAGAGGPDFDAELEFVRWALGRVPGSAWILIAEAADVVPVRVLFDNVEAELLVHPPDRRSLLRAIDRALRGRSAERLSRRQERDRLAARFARWFGRQEPRDLSRALQARHADHPLLVRGEPGTGRGLLIRYVHAFSAGRPGPLLRVLCSGVVRAEALLAQIEDGVSEAKRAARPARRDGLPAAGRWGIWLDAVDELPDALQMRVLDWIELGLPGGLVRGRVRWLATAREECPLAEAARPRLLSALDRALAELQLETTPLRGRPEAVEPFVEDTSRAWAEARHEAFRSFDRESLRALCEEPWPGNLRELEAMVLRTLGHVEEGTEPIGVDDLYFDAIRPEAAEDDTNAAEDADAEEGSEIPLEASRPAPGEAIREPEPAADLPSPDSGRAASAGSAGSLQRLAAAIAHEVRNPLVSIRTMSELLPEHYADEEFRTRFRELVSGDVRRIEEVVERLQNVAEASKRQPEIVDVTAMLDGLLDLERGPIQSRRLLVLKELDRNKPHAIADPIALRDALAALLHRALREVPERGDLYLASRHHPAAPAPVGSPEHTDASGASVRILFRYHTGSGAIASGEDAGSPTFRETVLDHEVAEGVIRAQGGKLTVDNTDASETVIVIDLPAPE
jgi:DNA-binding NtrC family response regulator